MKSAPIKRHSALKSVSREHHHSLLLSWKIRRGFSANIAPARMKKYVDWFYTNQIKDHFRIEEKYIFPILGEDHELVKKALAEHRRLERLFEDPSDPERTLSLIEEELEKHIRFEERILFQQVQKVASEEQLKKIDKHHHEKDFEDNLEDPFWNIAKK